MPTPHSEQVADRVTLAVVTVSDTRTLETDKSGDLLVQLFIDAGFTIGLREIVPDDRHRIANMMNRCVPDDNINAIVFCGGTGIAPRDTTVDAVEPCFDKPLPGFGEMFRALSASEIGTRAMLSRATAGIVQRTAVFVIPGSSNAARLAAEQLIIPELPHIVWLLKRG